MTERDLTSAWAGPATDIAARLRAGEPEAWEDLYRRVFPRLLDFAERRLDADRARDAVAETMTRAVAGIDRYRGAAGGVDGWLYGILRHVVTDAHRAAGRRRDLPATSLSQSMPEPDEIVELDEEHAALRRAFAALSAPDRELLELRVVGQLGVEDTAAALGKRPGAVRMAQSRALARLRRRLEEHP